MWVPRDIRFQGFDFPDSNINAGVFIIAKKTYSTVRSKRCFECEDHVHTPGNSNSDPSPAGPTEAGTLHLRSFLASPVFLGVTSRLYIEMHMDNSMLPCK